MADTAVLRRRNLTEVLKALDETGPTTASVLSERTGLSAATLSRALAVLKSHGLVISCGKDSTEQFGRRAELLSVCPDFGYFLYGHLHGDRLDGYLLDFRGNVLESRSVLPGQPLTPQRFSDCMQQLRALLLSGRERPARLLSAILSLPGIITQDGRVTRIPNYPELDGCSLAQVLTGGDELPCLLYNNARLCALGTHLHTGTAQETVVYMDITESCGIGAGIVLRGDIYEDRAGLAGEIGDMVLLPTHGFESRFHARGALESAAGLSRLFSRADELLKLGSAPKLRALMRQQHTDTVSLALLQTAAEQLDYDILDLLEQTVHAWAAAVINIAAVLAPDRIVIGGAVTSDDRVVATMLRQYISTAYYRPVNLEFASPDSDDHIRGAARLSKIQLFENTPELLLEELS